jgi:para-aminobenzoate synthetase component II
MVGYCAENRIPVFGVCLGLQAIAVAHGATVGRAPELLHGKTSPVRHDETGVFAGLPNPFTATRYHSLAIEPETLPEILAVTARTDTGVIMGVRHRELPIEAVQFHPESVLTEHGHALLGAFLGRPGSGAPQPSSSGST